MKQNFRLTALLRTIHLDLNSNLSTAKPSVLWKGCQVFKRRDRDMSFSIQKVTKIFISFYLQSTPHARHPTAARQCHHAKTRHVWGFIPPLLLHPVAQKHLQTKCWSVKVKGILFISSMNEPMSVFVLQEKGQELYLEIPSSTHPPGMSWGVHPTKPLGLSLLRLSHMGMGWTCNDTVGWSLRERWILQWIPSGRFDLCENLPLIPAFIAGREKSPKSNCCCVLFCLSMFPRRPVGVIVLYRLCRTLQGTLS